jgi:hypothetical protein
LGISVIIGIAFIISIARGSYKEKEDKLKSKTHKVCGYYTHIPHSGGQSDSIPRLKCSAPDFEATVHCKDENLAELTAC